MSTLTYNSPSLYGWWELDRHVVRGQVEKVDDEKIFQTYDEVTLSLDCDNRQIQFEHHRTNNIRYLTIDPQACRFPWKIVVLLWNSGDCVRILPENDSPLTILLCYKAT
jgi:hypothetical protein